MYEINPKDGGRTVAIVRFDPYSVDMKRPNMDSLRSTLQSIPDREQMNRDAGPEPDDEADSTSHETYQDPSTDFLRGQVAQAVSPGFVVSEVKRDDTGN